MKKMLSFLLAVAVLVTCAVPASAEEGSALNDQVKTMLYEWCFRGWKDPIPSIDTLIVEDALGNSTNGNYLIYHVYSTEMVFTDAHVERRVGDRMLSFTHGNTGFAGCEMKDGECVAVYSLEKAYDQGIINDAVLDRMNDPCHTMRVSIMGDVDHNDKIDVADLMGIKNRIMAEDLQYTSILQDVDGDGCLNVADLLALKNRLMDEKFLEKAKTYDEVYAEKMEYLAKIPEENAVYDEIILCLYREKAVKEPDMTAADFGLSDEYVAELIYGPHDRDFEEGRMITRIYTITQPEATPEAAAELMTKLQMHPRVETTEINQFFQVIW